MAEEILTKLAEQVDQAAGAHGQEAREEQETHLQQLHHKEIMAEPEKLVDHIGLAEVAEHLLQDHLRTLEMEMAELEELLVLTDHLWLDPEAAEKEAEELRALDQEVQEAERTEIVQHLQTPEAVVAEAKETDKQETLADLEL